MPDDKKNKIDYSALEKKYGPSIVENFRCMVDHKGITDLEEKQKKDMYDAIDGIGDMSLEETRARLDGADERHERIDSFQQMMKRELVQYNIELFN